MSTRLGKRHRHMMSARLARIEPFENLPPPLQPDHPHHRLAHRFGNTRDFEIEGIKRQQGWPLVGGRQQQAQKAVVIVLPDLGQASIEIRFYVGGVIHAASNNKGAARKRPPS
jgi:hypothetical protein